MSKPVFYFGPLSFIKVYRRMRQIPGWTQWNAFRWAIETTYYHYRYYYQRLEIWHLEQKLFKL